MGLISSGSKCCNAVINWTRPGSTLGAGGFWRGWNELRVKPGAFAKTSLRYDYGRFNEVVSALEVGLSIEYYPGGIPIMALQKEKPLFIQASIALLFGRRK